MRDACDRRRAPARRPSLLALAILFALATFASAQEALAPRPGSSTPKRELRVRSSVRSLQERYERGDKQPLEDLVRAWRGIQELSPSDPRSFFVLGGYHGEPFDERRAVDALDDTDRYDYWGGYCHHGNVLFPTWHRVYCLKLEEALRSIVPTVTLPFWDETSEETLHGGIPWILTAEKFELDGKSIDNPLRSFTLPAALADHVPSDHAAYRKPKGYTTVRYPLSGLVGTPEALAQTKAHNERYPDPTENVRLLNANVIFWIDKGDPTPGATRERGPQSVYWKYANCLLAPNYTAFSNTTSAADWNLGNPRDAVTALESPHNDIHLAVGGFDVPGQSAFGLVAGANGDMGENNTAALDPIFFFHHCNVDRMFWLWQQRHGATAKLEVLAGYGGTSSMDSQGPTPGIPPGAQLSLTTPLHPFVKDAFGTLYTSEDCIDVEKQLGYTYGPGSLEEAPLLASVANAHPKLLVVRGIDRGAIDGSFVVRAYARLRRPDGSTEERLVGTYAVFSRAGVRGCANCLTHLEVIATFPLYALSPEEVERAEFFVRIQHRDHEEDLGVQPRIEVRG